MPPRIRGVLKWSQIVLNVETLKNLDGIFEQFCTASFTHKNSEKEHECKKPCAEHRIKWAKRERSNGWNVISWQHTQSTMWPFILRWESSCSPHESLLTKSGVQTYLCSIIWNNQTPQRCCQKNTHGERPFLENVIVKFIWISELCAKCETVKVHCCTFTMLECLQ